MEFVFPHVFSVRIGLYCGNAHPLTIASLDAIFNQSKGSLCKIFSYTLIS